MGMYNLYANFQFTLDGKTNQQDLSRSTNKLTGDVVCSKLLTKVTDNIPCYNFSDKSTKYLFVLLRAKSKIWQIRSFLLQCLMLVSWLQRSVQRYCFMLQLLQNTSPKLLKFISLYILTLRGLYGQAKSDIKNPFFSISGTQSSWWNFGSLLKPKESTSTSAPSKPIKWDFTSIILPPIDCAQKFTSKWTKSSNMNPQKPQFLKFFFGVQPMAFLMR